MTQEIKQRIEQIKRGEVPRGYKRTKVGIVPSEWETKKISQYIKLCERPIEMQDNTEYELVTVRRFYNGVDSRGLFLGSKILVKTQFKVKTGDFVISKRQISHGACGVLPEALNDSIVSNEYNVFVGINETDTFFFNLYMQKPRCQNLFYLMSDGVHIEKLLFKTNQWAKQKIALPPLPEQKKIAEILTTCDKAIKLKEKLLSEKQVQKKSLMQNILTGKKRLSGFSGEWKKIKLGELFSERTERNAIHLPLLAITGTKGVVPRSDLDLKDNSSEDKSKYLKICIGDIGYNTMRMWQGVSAFSEYEGIVSPAYTILKPKENINAKYFSYLFKMPSEVFMFYRFSQGLVDDTRNLKYSNFKQIKVCYPTDLQEQTAIAEILTTADKEIELLQKQLTNEKQKKKALMQLLLTGIVRV